MSIALACVLVISASLVSGMLQQRREARAIQNKRDPSKREAFSVRVTVDRSHLGSV
jgi:hypothetical protein